MSRASQPVQVKALSNKCRLSATFCYESPVPSKPLIPSPCQRRAQSSVKTYLVGTRGAFSEVTVASYLRHDGPHQPPRQHDGDEDGQMIVHQVEVLQTHRPTRSTQAQIT